MATKRALVIVESPTKVKTIQKYLDSKYIVKASMGHVRDLPKSQLGVDPKKNFKPKYVVTPAKKKVLDELKKAAERVDTLYVATDPDREGEAIGWHLAEELDVAKKNVFRITFNEITERAVKAAFKNPGKIDLKKVDAQLLGQMPADRLALAIRVGRDVERVGLRRGALQLVNGLLLGLQHDVLRHEGLLVDAERRLRQIADVPHRGFHDELRIQILLDRPDLRR